ncbi:hypothetical protein F511_41657 [Dorcoceras hygrometricum]|uniref:Uncharacterized protein n=1 Tax=Dorcoceras hygrometricum TaxID=472368 RepID=A0A2Z7BAG5_9LAMI|nr:hypothetical protein F511_41657 [Dorcoceras hygrometricum]
MGMGIDQLNLHSVQLGYLKILKVGNADPTNTKAGKQIRGQASLDQRINWQIKSLKPLYHAQQVSRWKSSVRDIQGPSTHHSSVVFRHNNQSITTPMIALDFSGTTNQSASHNVALKQNHIIKSHNINYSHVHAKAAKSAQLVPFCSNLPQPILTKARLRSEPCSSSTSLQKLETTRNAHPETQTSRRTNELLCTRTQQLRTSFPTLIQGFKCLEIERETLKESSATKIAQIIGGERRQSTEIGHGEQ